MDEKGKLIQALNSFNERADDLHSSKFIESLIEDGLKVTLAWDKRNEGIDFESTRTGPDKTAIQAFLMDYRFFIQNNDRISLRNMNGLYGSALIPDELRNEFIAKRSKLNTYLDSSTEIEIDSVQITNRILIETFLYGTYSHFTKEEEFKRWKSMPMIFPIMEHRFASSLVDLVNLIQEVKATNIKVLAILNSSS